LGVIASFFWSSSCSGEAVLVVVEEVVVDLFGGMLRRGCPANGVLGTMRLNREEGIFGVPLAQNHGNVNLAERLVVVVGQGEQLSQRQGRRQTRLKVRYPNPSWCKTNDNSQRKQCILEVGVPRRRHPCSTARRARLTAAFSLRRAEDNKSNGREENV
jgi:hypothetical protein